MPVAAPPAPLAKSCPGTATGILYAHDMSIRVAKYPGNCHICHQPIAIGDEILWAPGRKSIHGRCGTVAAAPSDPARMPTPPILQPGRQETADLPAPPKRPPLAPGPTVPALSPRLQTVTTLRAAFQYFGTRPNSTHLLQGDTLLLHVEPCAKGLNEIRAHIDEQTIWLLESTPGPGRSVNIFWQGRLMTGTSLAMTDDLANTLKKLAHPNGGGHGR